LRHRLPPLILFCWLRIIYGETIAPVERGAKPDDRPRRLEESFRYTFFVDRKKVLEINRLRGRRSLLFVNKKKQKNFVNWGCIGSIGGALHRQKFFASFFQKRCFFLPCNLSLPAR